jgi:hypothetical protein
MFGPIDLTKVEQVDDLTYTYVNGCRNDIDEWLKDGCAHKHTAVGYNDGGRVRLTFADTRGSVEFKLRFENIWPTINTTPSPQSAAS